MKAFNAIFDALLDTLFYISCLLLVGQVFVEIYEIIGRHILNNPPRWGVDFCEYTLFLIGFLGTPWVLRQREHISVTIVLERLKPASRMYCSLFTSLVGIIVSIVIFYFGFKNCWESYVANVKIVKTFFAPKWIFMLFISYGYLLMTIEFTRQFWGHVRGLKFMGDPGPGKGLN